MLRELAKEVYRLCNQHPDYVYNTDPIRGCSYFTGECLNEGRRTGKYGCIVGQAAKNIGYNEFLNKAVIIETSPDRDNSVSAVLNSENETEEEKFLYNIQLLQDTGSRWKTCLIKHENEFGKPSFIE